jgi:Ser/Thr protein kinase RdoA (MazF antagonist)
MIPAPIDPFAVLSTAVPNVGEKSARALLDRRYGMSGKLERLSSERDLNYLVRERSGSRFVLKIANSAEEPGVTDFQNRALQYLEQHHPQLPVPRVIHTLNGQPGIRIEADDGRNHTSRLLSWLPGTPLERIGQPPDIATQLGTSLAALGNGLRDFTHPSADYPLLWDIRQAGQLAPVVGHIADPALRDACEARFRHFEDVVDLRLRDCREQVVFNDLNWGNVLVDPADPVRVTGIIDFGDLVHSFLAVDIAVAAAYLFRDDTDSLSDVRKFLRGYHAVTPILPIECELLPDLMQMRNVLSITIANWRASRYPENRDYLLRSLSRATSMLALLDSMDTKVLAAELRSAAEEAPQARNRSE